MKYLIIIILILGFQSVFGQSEIVYKSTEFQNRDKTYYQNTYIIINFDNNTITFTDNNSFTFRYNAYNEVKDLYLDGTKVGLKIMIKNNKLLKSVSLFVLGNLPENSILQEYHDGTMLEYFGITQIKP